METTSNGGISRPSSVGSNVNAPNQNQNFTPTSNSFTTISSSNFSPSSNAAPSYVESNMQNQASSGNAKPGYPQVNSSPQLASHNSSGYPGGQFSGQNIQPNNQNQMTVNDPHNQHQSWASERDRNSWEPNEMQHQGFVQHNNQHNMQNMQHNQNQMGMKSMNQNMQIVNTGQSQNNSHLQQPMPSPQNHQQNNQMQMHMQGQSQNNMNQSPNHMNHQMHSLPPNSGDNQFSQADRVNLNSRIKTMILNKQQNMEGKMEDEQKADENNTTGHFLSYSHHRRLNYFSDGGGLPDFNPAPHGSALENIMKFASNENYTQPKWNQNSSVNPTSYKPFSYVENSSLDKNILMNMKMDNTYYPYNDNPLPVQKVNLPMSSQGPFNNNQFIETPQRLPLLKSERTNHVPIQASQKNNNSLQMGQNPSNQILHNHISIQTSQNNPQMHRNPIFVQTNQNNLKNQKNLMAVKNNASPNNHLLIQTNQNNLMLASPNSQIQKSSMSLPTSQHNQILVSPNRNQQSLQTSQSNLKLASPNNSQSQMNYMSPQSQNNTIMASANNQPIQTRLTMPTSQNNAILTIPNPQFQRNIPISQNNQSQSANNSYLLNVNEHNQVYIKPEPYQNYNTQENQYKVEPEPQINKVATSQHNHVNSNENHTHSKPDPVPHIKEEVKEIKLEKEAYVFEGHGGPASFQSHGGSWCCRRGGTEPPTPEHLRDGACIGLQTQDEIIEEKNPDKKNPNQPEFKNTEKSNANKEYNDNIEKLKNNVKTEIPDCSCFPPDKSPPEPGSYYTHLGKCQINKLFS